MKLIPLTKGMFAKVDDADFEELSKHKWQVRKRSRGEGFYAQRHFPRDGKPQQSCIQMHQQILGTYKTGLHIDHENADGLDNQRHNIRIADKRQNAHNARKRPRGSSRYKGVDFHKMNSNWRARLFANGKQINIGSFSSEEDAAQAYNNMAFLHFGEFSKLNQSKISFQ